MLGYFLLVQIWVYVKLFGSRNDGSMGFNMLLQIIVFDIVVTVLLFVALITWLSSVGWWLI